jgi:MiaB-like tRNA modifying enzyme
MRKVFFKTFGCRTNIFDTQVMISNLQSSTAVSRLEDADTIIINSCTVTNSADTNSRTYLNSLKRDFPEKEILFTGCGVATQGEKFYKADSVKSVFGHSEKERVEDFINSKERVFEIGDLSHIDSTIVENFVGKSRAFIKIQEGCNFSCSYCIIPAVRGKSRSYSEKLIIEQVSRLANNGFGEFVLTGTNIGSYGDSKKSLAKLLKKLSDIRGVRRIRLGSVEPSQISDEFKELLTEKWFGKHLHIALQHTDNRMLKIMSRRNRLESDLKLFSEISEKGFALGTDYIVGHPGESDEIFESAFKNLKEFPLTHIHLFRYSKRDGTPSASMREINGKVVKERFSRVEQLIEEKATKFREEINSPLEVLFEQKKGDFYTGYDQFFFPINYKSSEDIEGEWRELSSKEVNF